MKTEYESQPGSARTADQESDALRIPDHAIERFAKFLYPRFLVDMEQRRKSKE